jgi:hypothetical protein
MASAILGISLGGLHIFLFLFSCFECNPIFFSSSGCLFAISFNRRTNALLWLAYSISLRSSHCWWGIYNYFIKFKLNIHQVLPFGFECPSKNLQNLRYEHKIYGVNTYIFDCRSYAIRAKFQKIQQKMRSWITGGQ